MQGRQGQIDHRSAGQKHLLLQHGSSVGKYHTSYRIACFFLRTAIQADYGRQAEQQIYLEDSLRDFERDTVDHFVEAVLDGLTSNESLCQKFNIQGNVQTRKVQQSPRLKMQQKTCRSTMPISAAQMSSRTEII